MYCALSRRLNIIYWKDNPRYHYELGGFQFDTLEKVQMLTTLNYIRKALNYLYLRISLSIPFFLKGRINIPTIEAYGSIGGSALGPLVRRPSAVEAARRYRGNKP